MVQEDPSGRDRITRNLLYSWGGSIVFLVAGFIMPRFIDRHLGQTMLGVWDFGWSIVTYFGLASMGVGSSVNRYVAKYRAEEDAQRLNRSMSSVMLLQMLAAMVIFVLTVLATLMVPLLLRLPNVALVDEARFVVFFLGISIAIKIAFDTYDGVITGCHRWDLHNMINAGGYAVSIICMLTAMSLGGGIRSLAILYFIGTATTEIARLRIAKYVCPELDIRFRNAERAEARIMFEFGGKAFLGSISNRLLYQTNSIIIASYLGAAVLATYSRPMALVLAVGTIVSKFAYMLTPIASHLDAAGNKEDLRKLLIQTTRYSVYMALPPLIFIFILGNPILLLWMGKRYAEGDLMMILALGHLASFAHRPSMNILTGLGAHGKPAMIYLGTALISVVASLFIIGGMDGGVTGAAISISVSLLIADGIVIPVYACRRLDVPVVEFFRASWVKPVLCAIPFVICLLTIRLLVPGKPAVALTAGFVSGCVILTPVYWTWVLPTFQKEQILKIIGRVRRVLAFAV